MEIVFASKLKSFLDAVSEELELYVPVKNGEYFTYRIYDSSGKTAGEFSNIRACTPTKEFLFPIRETVATYPNKLKIEDIKPFAVFGLKECDLHSMEILDKVFAEEDFEDPFYIKRRKSMFVISSDCLDPGETCFCSLFGGRGFAEKGFDINVSRIKDGFIIESGSQRGKDFLIKHSQIFGDVPNALLSERDANRANVKTQLEENNASLKFDTSLKQLIENSAESDVFDTEAKNCVECQACTRVCPTCHCFYLYDTQRDGYFAKMKMWDSCMRLSYATVAGGENPNKILGDRMQHRLLHKFVHFLDRYGVDMCVGCGRCIDADAGGMDIREVFKKLKQGVQK
ncbi:MAG: 4Fe-4S dicluster domain-containing protein [Planctomycetota bacterium]|jgi:ferredoxin